MLRQGMDADFCLWRISTPAELAYSYGVNPLVDVIKGGKLIHQ
jgi:imidazolonepropionase